jgi:MYXO-CTERM domain-containing protein
MRQSLFLSSLAALLAASTADAATLYVSPTGDASSDCATRAAPCSLATAASSAVAGDTVVLMDGVYQEPLYVANSGTSSAWITFEADECATPILEGEGSGPNDDVQSTGVGSEEAEYVRFRGLVSRGWNIGFGNGWAGGTDSDEVSNGHWEIEYCAAYSNGRTGFTFFSAEGFHLANSIVAHNGSSVLHSWSSGVTLFEAAGSANKVEGTVSFENTDAEKHTDGSGFIVDEESNNATFVNNIAFGNGGSCLRLTRSSGTRFINNTCYHNSQFGSQATGPSNPGELYFTGGGVTLEGVTFMNNIIAGTGQSPAGSEPVINKPSSGWTNNVETTGSVNFFTDATGTNPNFVPSSGATQLIGAGSGGNGAPSNDIGFDPKCIVKRTPVMVGSVARESWWQYDVDIDYIKSIGGVAKCFHPATRSGNPDIGAYKTGNVTTATPGSCVPPDPGPTGGTGGTGGAGTGGMGGVTTAGTGGMGGTGTGGRGVAGGPGTGGAATGGRSSAGGSGTGGVGGPGTGGMGGTSVGGMVGTGATSTGGMVGTGAADTGGTVGAGATGTGTGGTGPGAGGALNAGGTPGTGPASGGGTSVGTTSTGGLGTGAAGGGGPGQDSSASAGDDGGCGCRAAGVPDHRGGLAALGILGMGLLARRRRAVRGGALR